MKSRRLRKKGLSIEFFVVILRICGSQPSE